MSRDDVPASVRKLQDRLLAKALGFLVAAVCVVAAASLVHLALGLLVTGVVVGYVAAKL